MPERVVTCPVSQASFLGPHGFHILTVYLDIRRGNVLMNFAGEGRVGRGAGAAGWPQAGRCLDGKAKVVHSGTHNYFCH